MERHGEEQGRERRSQQSESEMRGKKQLEAGGGKIDPFVEFLYYESVCCQRVTRYKPSME